MPRDFYLKLGLASSALVDIVDWLSTSVMSTSIFSLVSSAGGGVGDCASSLLEGSSAAAAASLAAASSTAKSSAATSSAATSSAATSSAATSSSSRAAVEPVSASSSDVLLSAFVSDADGGAELTDGGPPVPYANISASVYPISFASVKHSFLIEIVTLVALPFT